MKHSGKASSTIHVWQKHEITLKAEKTYSNPYTEVELWVDLKGPGGGPSAADAAGGVPSAAVVAGGVPSGGGPPPFEKRVYGFWDGDNLFRVRIVATAPGQWTWTSGSNQTDSGLSGQTGSFLATDWTDAEKQENPNRRGFIVASQNGHALEYADGTSFFLLGDTWWPVPTFRYPWYDDDKERPIGPDMGLKDMVRYRKKQGYNSIAMIAAYPAWANDGKPSHIELDDDEHTVVRNAWKQAGTQSAEDMHNEGGRPFHFPGTVPGYEDVFPDVNRINPSYFQHMDKKIDFLNDEGFVPFIEVVRRDISQAWKKCCEWPETYARMVQYIFSRYQANSCILSPIHLDTDRFSIPSRDYNEPANLVVEKYGAPPFGTLVSSNAHYSNYRNFGGPDEAKWLTMYQTGNRREHVHNWYLTELFNLPTPQPALNGEPYYHLDPNGWPYRKQPAGPVEEELYCRSGLYGSVLSGGLAGHIYGAMGLWQGSIEEAASPRMWESIEWESAAQMQHILSFIEVQGDRYKDLIPCPEYITPNKVGDPIGYKGWAYCAGTKQRDLFLLYFEKEHPDGAVFRGAIPGQTYTARWFDPRTGQWTNIEQDLFNDPATGRIELPATPTNNDWGMMLVRKER